MFKKNYSIINENRLKKISTLVATLLFSNVLLAHTTESDNSQPDNCIDVEVVDANEISNKDNDDCGKLEENTDEKDDKKPITFESLSAIEKYVVPVPLEESPWSGAGSIKLTTKLNPSGAAKQSSIGFAIKRKEDSLIPFNSKVSLAAGKSNYRDTIYAITPDNEVYNSYTYDIFNWEGNVSKKISEEYKLDIEAGKCDSVVGMANAGENVGTASSSWVTKMVPSAASGAILSWEVNDNANMQVSLANGWNEDINNFSGNVCVSANGKYSPKFKTGLDDDGKDVTKQPYTVGVSGYLGRDGSTEKNEAKEFGGIGFPNSGFTTVQVYNAYGKYKVTDELTAGLEGTYGMASKPNEDSWYGVNLGVAYQMNSNLTYSGRLEWIHDDNGLKLKSKKDDKLHSVNAYAAAIAVKYKFTDKIALSGECKYRWAELPIIEKDDSKLELSFTQTYSI